jgi:hypothetical protein
MFTSIQYSTMQAKHLQSADGSGLSAMVNSLSVTQKTATTNRHAADLPPGMIALHHGPACLPTFSSPTYFVLLGQSTHPSMLTCRKRNAAAPPTRLSLASEEIFDFASALKVAVSSSVASLTDAGDGPESNFQVGLVNARAWVFARKWRY